ncbi:MAG: ribonuclease HI [Flavobacteriales bacterium TMED84]|nr:MAG: ribonuclease HI [Flavobacteriales bacterium TMED84]RPG53876.1 MAG: ribonuclease HI [Flavobacteriales bacterium TMED84]|tara:strand:- start:8528 stop:9007 length:480 start_codon:yes stop_codon:yes gene_type:complete
MKVSIYTDGSSRGNPGRGGYGVVLLYEGHRKEISEGYRLTTNNRMELQAVIVGLEALKSFNKNIVIYSDSKYVVNAVEKKWLFNWEKNNFKKKKNKDLWLRFLKIYRKHRVRFIWIKGHSEIVENERCDFLAVQATKKKPLKIDEYYETSIKQEPDTLF